MNTTPTPQNSDDAGARESRQARLAGLAEQAAREDAPDPAPELARDPDFQRLLLRRRLSHLALLVGAVPTPGMLAELAAGASAAEASSADALFLAGQSMARAGKDRAEGAAPASEESNPEMVRQALRAARAINRVFPFPMLAPARSGARPAAFAMVARSQAGLWLMERKPGTKKLRLPHGAEPHALEPHGSPHETSDSKVHEGIHATHSAPHAESVEIDRVELPEVGEARLLWRDALDAESVPEGSVWADPADPATPMDPELRAQLAARAIPLLKSLPHGSMSARLEARRSTGVQPNASRPTDPRATAS